MPVSLDFITVTWTPNPSQNAIIQPHACLSPASWPVASTRLVDNLLRWSDLPVAQRRASLTAETAVLLSGDLYRAQSVINGITKDYVTCKSVVS